MLLEGKAIISWHTVKACPFHGLLYPEMEVTGMINPRTTTDIRTRTTSVLLPHRTTIRGHLMAVARSSRLMKHINTLQASKRLDLHIPPHIPKLPDMKGPISTVTLRTGCLCLWHRPRPAHRQDLLLLLLLLSNSGNHSSRIKERIQGMTQTWAALFESSMEHYLSSPCKITCNDNDMK